MNPWMIAMAVAGKGVEGPILWPSGFNSHSTTTNGVSCYAVLAIEEDGELRTNALGSGPAANTLEGDWCADWATPSDYYAERTLTGGTPGTLNYADDLATRVQLNVERNCGVLETTTLETHTCTFTINFYDAASGGNLLRSENFSLSAFKDTP